MADIKNHASLTTSLVSYWDFEEASGTRYDLHGTNDLTSNGTGGVGQATGKIGNGADFVETDSDYLSISDNASLSNWGDHSISFWYKADATGNDATIMGKWTTAGRGVRIWFGTDDKLNHAYYSSNSAGANTQTGQDVAVTVTDWHLYTWTVDVSAQVGILYVDGASVAVTKVSSGASATYDESSALNIGAFNNGGNEFTDGIIDEFGIWTKILTSDEASDLYNSGSGLPYYDPADVKNDTTLSTSLVSYWEMEEATAASRLDSVTASGNDLTNNSSGSGITQVTGVRNDGDYAADLEYTTDLDYFSRGYADLTGLAITGDVSVSAWVKMESIALASFVISVAGSTESSGDNHLYSCRIETDGDVGMFWEYGGGSNTFVVSTAGSYITTGNWHHIVWTRDVSTNTCIFYVDGVLAYTNTYTSDATDGSTAPLCVGGQQGTQASFDGILDEVAVYSKYMGVDEVRALYGYGTPPVYEVAVASTFVPKMMMF